MKYIAIWLLALSVLQGCSSTSNQAELVQWLMQQWSEYLIAENFSGALATFDEVIQLDPSFSDGYAQKWYTQMLQGDVPSAMKSLATSLEINPSSVQGLTNMWIAESLQGNFDWATEFLDQALLLDPSNIKALVYKWNSIADKGDLTQAISYYDKALAIDPSWYLTWFNKWTVLSDLGFNNKDASKSKQAITHYNLALERNPNFHIAHIFIWVSQFDQQLFDDALSSVNKWLIQMPNNIDGLYYKWLILSQLERYEDAKASLKRVLELNPGYGYAQQELDRIQSLWK